MSQEFRHSSQPLRQHRSVSRPGPAVNRTTLTVRQVGALSDLDNVTVRVADVAARLAVLGDRRRDELGPSTFP